jgi:hypothetical protein
MSAPRRYGAHEVAPKLPECEEGAYVLFADVEPALQDAGSMSWLLPVLDYDTRCPETAELSRRRTAALGTVYGEGLRGRDLVREAMRR